MLFCRRFILSLFFLVAASAYADDPSNLLPLAEVAGEPSAIIAGCVNAVTGNYSQAQVDLVLNGPDPLILQRFYSSADWRGGSFSDGWNHNHACSGSIQADKASNCYWACLPHASGGSMLYFSGRGLSYNEYWINHPDAVYLGPIKKEYRKGLTNTASGEISARTNFKNVSLLWKNAGSSRIITVDFPHGGARTFKQSKKTFGKVEEVGPLRLVKETRPSGNQFHYTYRHHGDSKQLDSITATDPTGNIVFSTITFGKTDFSLDAPILYIAGSDGRRVKYTLHRSTRQGYGREKPRFYVRVVERPNAPPEEYKYSPRSEDINHERIIEKRSGGRIVQQIDYYHPGKNNVRGTQVQVKKEREKDLRAGKVCELRAPVGPGDQLITTHNFFYHLEHPHKQAHKYTSGYTEVRDAFNRKSVYHFSGDDLLTHVERYLGTDHPTKYSTDKFYWGKDSQHGDLICKALVDADESVRSCRFLEYDNKHNVTAEHVLGILTGTNSIRPVLNAEGIPKGSGCDCYTVRRTFSNNAFNLLLSETLPNGRAAAYRYWRATALPEAKLITENGRIVSREFREYDGVGALTKIIVDDGSGSASDDYTNVTVRHMTYITPYTEAPWIGLPREVAEKYLDVSKGYIEEHFLGKVLNAYTAEGYLKTQKHYDAQDVHRYTLRWEYDGMGNVIEEEDALGRLIQRKFDQYGNKIYEKGPNPQYYTEYTYDFSNRLVAEEKFCNNGQRLRQSFRYDCLGNRIGSTDVFGNETTYQYDDLNRLVCTTLPATIGVDGKVVQLRTHKAYDIANNVIAEIDVHNQETRKTYNILGKPTRIEHPDNTVELFEYNLDGTLRCQTAPNGASTLFYYDLLGNVIRKERLSPAKELLQTTLATYRGHLLTSETDANTNVTHYSYDAAGRLTKASTATGWTSYEYDALGRKYKTTLWTGPLNDDVRITLVEYDLLNRPKEERVEDKSGKVLTRSCYDYDQAGNRSEETTFTEGGPATTQTIYNAHGQVVKVIDPEGNETITHYDYNHINGLYQRVLQTTTVDALGNSIVITNDALGRAVSTIGKDAIGQETSRTIMQYDGNGKLVKRIDTVKAADSPDRDLITEWQYDVMGRLSGIYEAVGTPKARQTLYVYNQFGEREFEILPENLSLQYRYDSLGRLASYHSSDGTIHYTYTYDGNSNILSVADEIQKTVTSRTYDSANRIVKETLANGLKASYRYDGANRVSHMRLPDGSGVVYHYTPAYLKEVIRTDKDGNKLYVHSYLQHDQTGLCTLAKAIKQAGEITYVRDKRSRLRHLKAAHFEEEIPDRGYDAVGNLVCKRRRDVIGEERCDYAYDPLYQLTSEEGIASHSYAHDSLNNRLKKDDAWCEIDELNQLLSQGEQTYTYDGRGNRVAHGNIQYAYDALGRLIEVKNKGKRWTYQYDPFNRRISKTAYDSADQIIDTERYLFSDQMDLGAFDRQDRVLQFRVIGRGLGAEIGAAIAIEIGQDLFAPLHDHNGNVVALLEPDTGKVAEAYRFTAFGEETLFRRDLTSGQWQKCGSSVNSWRFSSKRQDSETGLVCFGRRYFDPTIGRWITPDPKGSVDGPNRYAYVHNSPLTHIDRYGLYTQGFPPCWSATPEGLASAVSAFNMFMEGINAYNAFYGSMVGDWPPQIQFDDDFEARHPGYERSKRFDLGRTERENLQVSYICGMNNKESDCRANMEHISALGDDCNVCGVLNPTHGVLTDTCEAAMNIGGTATSPVRELHKTWDERLATLPEGCFLLHFCHSQGAAHTRNALLSYPPELRDRIFVVAIAPAAYIDPKTCGKVWHYVSTRDIVPTFDVQGRRAAQDTIRVLDPHPDAPLFDHAFTSPTYEEPIQKHLTEYMISGGRRM